MVEEGFKVVLKPLVCVIFRVLAEGFGEFYATNNMPPLKEYNCARVYASIIGLFIDLYKLTDKQLYLDQAERYARDAIEGLYYNGLFRGATNINHYEAEMMVGNLVYNLVWLHAVKTKADIEIEPNYFNR